MTWIRGLLRNYGGTAYLFGFVKAAVNTDGLFTINLSLRQLTI
jgi:hypothetical protein